jgi:hypothetical protein
MAHGPLLGGRPQGPPSVSGSLNGKLGFNKARARQLAELLHDLALYQAVGQ